MENSPRENFHLCLVHWAYMRRWDGVPSGTVLWTLLWRFRITVWLSTRRSWTFGCKEDLRARLCAAILYPSVCKLIMTIVVRSIETLATKLPFKLLFKLFPLIIDSLQTEPCYDQAELDIRTHLRIRASWCNIKHVRILSSLNIDMMSGNTIFLKGNVSIPEPNLS